MLLVILAGEDPYWKRFERLILFYVIDREDSVSSFFFVQEMKGHHLV